MAVTWSVSVAHIPNSSRGLLIDVMWLCCMSIKPGATLPLLTSFSLYLPSLLPAFIFASLSGEFHFDSYNLSLLPLPPPPSSCAPLSSPLSLSLSLSLPPSPSIFLSLLDFASSILLPLRTLFTSAVAKCFAQLIPDRPENVAAFVPHIPWLICQGGGGGGAGGRCCNGRGFQ